jgi:hypothetical protein
VCAYVRNLVKRTLRTRTDNKEKSKSVSKEKTKSVRFLPNVNYSLPFFAGGSLTCLQGVCVVPSGINRRSWQSRDRNVLHMPAPPLTFNFPPNHNHFPFEGVHETGTLVIPGLDNLDGQDQEIDEVASDTPHPVSWNDLLSLMSLV